MMKEEFDDVESRLKAVKFRPAPPGLRETILAVARKRKEATAWTTPLLRACLAACGGILVAVLALDALAAQSQSNRILALLNGAGATPSSFEARWAPIADDLQGVLESAEIEWGKRLMASREKTKAYDRADTLKYLLQEDSNASAMAKDLD